MNNTVKATSCGCHDQNIHSLYEGLRLVFDQVFPRATISFEFFGIVDRDLEEKIRNEDPYGKIRFEVQHTVLNETHQRNIVHPEQTFNRRILNGDTTHYKSNNS